MRQALAKMRKQAVESQYPYGRIRLFDKETYILRIDTHARILRW